jgi:hypothetical protein
VSTDKAEVKKVVQNFAAEILASEPADVKYEEVKAKVVKAGGANYGVYTFGHDVWMGPGGGNFDKQRQATRRCCMRFKVRQRMYQWKPLFFPAGTGSR